MSLTPTIGGDDIITLGRGIAVVIGGVGTDTITTQGVAGNQGTAVILGDAGRIVTNTQTGSSDFHLLLVETLFPEIGARDVINTSAGSDIIVGGLGDDEINAGNGDNIVTGDGARIVGDDLFPTDDQTRPMTLLRMAYGL